MPDSVSGSEGKARGIVRGARYEDGWKPWGLPFAVGMALHALEDLPRPHGWRALTEYEQQQRERRYPDNKFVQNEREADAWINRALLWRSMPVHDRPWHFVRLSGACGRPDGGLVQPHALWGLAHG